MKLYKSITLVVGVILAGFLILSLFGCSKGTIGPSISLEESTVNLGTHKLKAYTFTNNSNYVVIFESGLGDDHGIWNVKDITGITSKSSDILLYDRAGYGASEHHTNARGIGTLGDELNEVIEELANGRKVILVGHSLGGMIIRDFAIKYPSKTAALLFVDASHEMYNITTQEEEDKIYNYYKSTFGPNSGATIESRQMVENIQYLTGLPNLPDVPVIAITSMKIDAQHDADDKQLWYDSKEAMREGVTDFTHVTTTNSGHYIQLQEPQLVIDNIQLLLSKLK